MKTMYTMSEIKDLVKRLQYSAQKDLGERIRSEFNQAIEESAEIEFDLKSFEKCANTVNDLLKKHSNGSWYSKVDSNSLRHKMMESFESKFSEDKKKINSQFKIILDKLTALRNPDKALEFLALCGIELPEKVKAEVIIPVDPEFIKSVLPKHKMLAS